MADRAGAVPDTESGTCAVAGWQAGWVTCTGPTHVRDATPREDAVHARGQDGALVVAVGDGHGMARSFRAHIGSQFAVELAVAAALAARRRWHEPVSDVDAAQWLAEDFTSTLLRKWRARVREHQQAHPFTSAERALRGEDDALVAYGTTLLVAMAAGRRLLAWQVGDGDLIAAVAGHPAGPVVPVDPMLFGNRTTSLCQPDAEAQARTGALQRAGEPILLVIASDGFGNAMVAGDWQHRLGADLHERLQSGEFGQTARRLPSWAREAATASGDDVTVALLAGGYGPPEPAGRGWWRRGERRSRRRSASDK